MHRVATHVMVIGFGLVAIACTKPDAPTSQEPSAAVATPAAQAAPANQNQPTAALERIELRVVGMH